MAAAIDLYREYHVDRKDEQLGLFQKLRYRYRPRSALYPGSFVHVTPSFVIPTVAYVDLDRRAARFFDDPTVAKLVSDRREYDDEPVIRFHAHSYDKPLDEPEASFDLLISQLRLSGLQTIPSSRATPRCQQQPRRRQHGQARSRLSAGGRMQAPWRAIRDHRQRSR